MPYVYDPEDEFFEPGEFDDIVDTLKDAIRASIRKETQDELVRLRKSEADLKAKVSNLKNLERNATVAASEYRRMSESAFRDAKRTSAMELLKSLAAPKYIVQHTWEFCVDKCDKCNDERHITFKSPSGATLTETCACYEKARMWHVKEVFACEVGGRDSLIWYEVGNDTYARPKNLSRPTTIAEMVGQETYNDYGFDSREAAQEFADALNEKSRKKDA